MKKGLSILILLVFLFNVGGYYIVYWSLKYHTDRELRQRVDANRYHADETIELKIPVSLPYPIQSQDFQRVDGRFEHNGEFFKLIKHKLEGDTLYIVCIRDVETKELVQTIKDYVQLTQGLPGTDRPHKAIQFLSKLLMDFCSSEKIEIMHRDGYAMSMSFAELPENFIPPALPIHSPPPRV